MNIKDFKKRISSNIRTLTKWYDYKIGALEKDAGVSPGYVSRLSKEDSLSSMPLIDLLVETSTKFKVSIDSIVYSDFSKFANEDKKRLYLFSETLLYLTDTSQLLWKRNGQKLVSEDEVVGSYVVQYNNEISFYIFELESVNEECSGYSIWVENREKKTNVAIVNSPGPALYEILSRLYESAGASADTVFIDESADSAIRCFMAENGNVFKNSSELKKYKPLFDRLNGRKEEEITLTFFDIEQCLGFSLPASAYKYASFWANNTNGQHQHCKSWLDAGYKTINVPKSLIDQYITFKRIKEPNHEN